MLWELGRHLQGLAMPGARPRVVQGRGEAGGEVYSVHHGTYGRMPDYVRCALALRAHHARKP